MELDQVLREIRKLGWAVAAHNDYFIGGKRFAFWLFTHAETGRFIKREGESDLAAVSNALAEARDLENKQ